MAILEVLADDRGVRERHIWGTGVVEVSPVVLRILVLAMDGPHAGRAASACLPFPATYPCVVNHHSELTTEISGLNMRLAISE